MNLFILVFTIWGRIYMFGVPFLWGVIWCEIVNPDILTALEIQHLGSMLGCSVNKLHCPHMYLSNGTNSGLTDLCNSTNCVTCNKILNFKVVT